VLRKRQHAERDGRENGFKNQKVVLLVANEPRLPVTLREVGRGQGDPFPSLATMKLKPWEVPMAFCFANILRREAGFRRRVEIFPVYFAAAVEHL
jgi:hypothetical protein